MIDNINIILILIYLKGVIVFVEMSTLYMALHHPKMIVDMFVLAQTKNSVVEAIKILFSKLKVLKYI